MSNPYTVLESIPGFADAQVLSQLSGGPTNDSYLAEQGGEQFVLRIDKPEALRLGLDRHGEKEVCEVIAEAGMGSPPVFFDADVGIYLRRYLPGRTWARRDLDDLANLERLAVLLRQVHSLPPAGNVFEPLQAAARYAEHIGKPEARQLYSESVERFSAIKPATPALCHNDLVCENILESDLLMLIDWEYAGIGDPYFDLAIVVQHHGLGRKLAGNFLGAYLATSPTECDWLRLRDHCRFYESLLSLWTMRTTTL